jgi:hypothetical protein
MTDKSKNCICHAIYYYRKQAASLSCYDAQKLDIGVAGMEILSGSRDLLSLPERMLLEVANQLTREIF